MDDYWSKIDKLAEEAKNHSYLDINNFISMTLSESGFYLSMMDNVYIVEIVDYPDVFGCYEKNGKLFSYVVNSYGEKSVREYDDPVNFMLAFVSTAPNVKKFENNDIKRV